MHDNRLAAALIAQGHDVLLFPLYTPLRTDETDVSQRRVYYGGVNAYLQQTAAFFRHTPWLFDRILDTPAVLRAVSRLANRTSPAELGPMTLSIMKGDQGAQRKELEKLVTGLCQLKPDLVYLPNLMFVGLARRLKQALGVTVLCGLTGEDIFLDRLPEPYHGEIFALIQQQAREVDGFVALTDYYAGYAAQHFSLPPEKIHRITMGIHAADFAKAATAADDPFTIGYLARICPEKGLAELGEAFIRLRQAGKNCRLRVAGYCSESGRSYLARIRTNLRQNGVDDDDFDFVGEVDREEKISFLQSLHVLSVPTSYLESKGIYVLEALAAGVPVVLPEHGSFPELVNATGGGLLHTPADVPALAEMLMRLMDEPTLRHKLATNGRQVVQASFTTEKMAAQTWQLFQQFT